MITRPKILLHINVSKPYYYPGDIVSGSISIDVQEEVNCNQMTIIAKGTQIIKASKINKSSNKVSSSSGSDDDKYKSVNIISENPKVKIEKEENIFNISQDIFISENNSLVVGRHSFPFEFELPEGIPGTFLFL